MSIYASLEKAERLLEGDKDNLKQINRIMEDIWSEFKRDTLNLNYIDVDEVDFDKSDKEQYEILIPYSAISGNVSQVVKRAKNLVNRFYKESNDDKYTIDVEDDDDNEKVRIGVWR